MVDVGREFTEEAVSRGIAGGSIAGIVLLLVQSLAGYLLRGAWQPPARLLGEAVLSGVRPVWQAGVGILFHMLISSALGALFISFLVLAGQAHAPRGRTALWGVLYGFTVWMAMVALGIHTAMSNAGFSVVWEGFAAVSFFFGAVLGIASAAQPRAGAVSAGQRSFSRKHYAVRR